MMKDILKLGIGTLIGAGIVYAIIQNNEPRGVGDLWGDNPNPTPADAPVFKHFSVVYLKMEADGGMRVQQAFFETTKTSKEDVDKDVELLIKNRFNADGWNDQCRIDCGPNAIPASGNSQYPYQVGFRNFGFSAPMRLYIYIANNNMSFDKIWPVMPTKYSAQARYIDDPKNWDKPLTDLGDFAGKKGALVDKNKTFFGANAAGFGSIAEGKVAYVENWHRDRNGKPIKQNASGKKDLQGIHSLNFNLWVKRTADPKESTQAPVELIPLVIDPDTGNGNGVPPPPIKPS